MKSYDAIIIGAGHNGMIAAAKLARSGLSVLVVEGSESYGGMARVETLAHDINVSFLASNALGLSSDVVSELDLESHGLKLDKTQRKTVCLGSQSGLIFGANFGEEVIGISLAENREWQKLRKKFIIQAKVFQNLSNKIPLGKAYKPLSAKLNLFSQAVGLRLRGREEFQEFMRMITMCTADLVEEVIENESLQGLIGFDSTLGIKLAPRSPTSYLGLLYRLAQLQSSYKGKYLSPNGGVKNFVNSVFQSAEAKGVKFLFDSKVKKIMVSNSEVSGVGLENGEIYNAKTIISATSPVTTFLELLGPKHLDTDFIRKISYLRNKGNVSKFNIILDSFPEAKDKSISSPDFRFVYAPSLGSVENSFNSSKYSELPEDPNFELLFNTVEPTSSSGERLVASMSIQNTSYDMKFGWNKSKKILEGQLISTLRRFFPEIEKKIISQYLLTPPEIEQKYSSPGGHWHHSELQIDSLYSLRPSFSVSDYSTSIRGCFICGAGTHPGGGIFGLSGLNAAKRVLKSIKVRV